MFPQRLFRTFAFFVVCLILLAVDGFADDSEKLAALDIEQLMDVEVVTASRRAEPLSQVPGAVTVLDEDDIFRSGATTVPQVLKLVPGVHVAQVDTDKWAVGVRGFNGLLSNKHLVLLDGRPVTSPTMAGVDWGDIVPIDSIKRIEVVRGTWTSLWGADSFTGVINIITKSAAETQGARSVTLVGSTGVEQSLRFGDKAGETGNVRAYVKGAYENGNWLTGDGGERSSRDWVSNQGGFRADWENAYTDLFSLQGGVTVSKIRDGGAGGGPIAPARDRSSRSGYMQLVWDRATGLDAGIKARTSFTRDGQSFGDLDGGTNVLDAEVQYAVEQTGRHRLTWGVGSRYYWDDFTTGDHVSMDDNQRHTFTSNGFIQDRITLSDDGLYLFLGSKLDYFGEAPLELQPSIRLLHTLDDQEYWLAVSRAVRLDNRMQRSGSYSVKHRGKTYTVNAPDSLTPERLIAYEAGYRRVLSDTARMDINLYVNDYSSLIMLDFDSATNTAVLNNSLHGTAYGVEAMVEWQVRDWLKLRPIASLIYQNIYGEGGDIAGDSLPQEGLGSEIKLQFMTTPVKDVGLDIFLGYLDSPDERNLPGYFSLETHASWRATDHLMLELIGRNLGGWNEQFSKLKVGPSLDLRMTWDF